MFETLYKALFGTDTNATDPITSDQIVQFLTAAKDDHNLFQATLELATIVHTLGAKKSDIAGAKKAGLQSEEEQCAFAVEKIKEVLRSHATALSKLQEAVVAYDALAGKAKADILKTPTLLETYKKMPKNFQDWLLVVSDALNEHANAQAINPTLVAQLAALNSTLVKFQVSQYKVGLPHYNVRAILEKKYQETKEKDAELEQVKKELAGEKKKGPSTVASMEMVNQNQSVRMLLGLCQNYWSIPQGLLIWLIVQHLSQNAPNSFNSTVIEAPVGSTVTASYVRNISQPKVHLAEYRTQLIAWIEALIHFKKTPDQIADEISKKFLVINGKSTSALGDDMIRFKEFLSTNTFKKPIDLSRTNFQKDELPWAKDYASRLFNFIKTLNTYQCDILEFNALIGPLEKVATTLDAEYQKTVKI
jgi:hypothetical protein